MRMMPSSAPGALTRTISFSRARFVVVISCRRQLNEVRLELREEASRPRVLGIGHVEELYPPCGEPLQRRDVLGGDRHRRACALKVIPRRIEADIGYTVGRR